MARPPQARPAHPSPPHARAARRMIGYAAVLVGLLMLVAGSAAAGLVDAARMTLTAPLRPKDFAITKRGDMYHLFYIIHDDNSPLTERTIGHSVSTNLYTWTRVEDALIVRPDQWDNEQLWAPTIVEDAGVTYMFYTAQHGFAGPGTTWYHDQQIGVAVSTDPGLRNWNRLDLSATQPVLVCNQFPWTICDPAWPTFRDPFVMRDPSNPSHWLLYLSTRVNALPGNANAVPGLLPDWGNSSIVSVAGSTGSFGTWTPIEPMNKTHRTFTDSNLPIPPAVEDDVNRGFRTVESPHLFRHNGLWYLFFSIYTYPDIMYMTGPDPVGAADTWTLRGFLANTPPPGELRTSTNDWYGTEYLADGADEYFCNYVGNSIEIRRMAWGANGDWRFALRRPFRLDSMRIADPGGSPVQRASEGSTLNLIVNSSSAAHESVALDVVQFLPGGAQVVIPPSRIGLPEWVVVNGPTTIVPFTVAAAGTTVETYRVRSRRSPEVFSDSLAIDPIVVDPHRRPDDPGEDGHQLMFAGRQTRRDVTATSSGEVTLRALRDTPLGSGLAFLIELPRPDHVRLDLFDVRGARVRTLIERELPSGASLEPWDGRSAEGAMVGSGIYFAKLTTGGATRSVRVVIAR
jgi:Glycosyl hydrolases family 32 N-terminal domain